MATPLLLLQPCSARNLTPHPLAGLSLLARLYAAELDGKGKGKTSRDLEDFFDRNVRPRRLVFSSQGSPPSDGRAPEEPAMLPAPQPLQGACPAPFEGHGGALVQAQPEQDQVQSGCQEESAAVATDALPHGQEAVTSGGSGACAPVEHASPVQVQRQHAPRGRLEDSVAPADAAPAGPETCNEPNPAGEPVRPFLFVGAGHNVFGRATVFFGSPEP